MLHQVHPPLPLLPIPLHFLLALARTNPENMKTVRTDWNLHEETAICQSKVVACRVLHILANVHCLTGQSCPHLAVRTEKADLQTFQVQQAFVQDWFLELNC